MSSSHTASTKAPSSDWGSTIDYIIKIGLYISGIVVLYLAYLIFSMKSVASDYVEPFFSGVPTKLPDHPYYATQKVVPEGKNGLLHKWMKSPIEPKGLIPESKLRVYLGESIPNGVPPIADPLDPRDPSLNVTGNLGGPKSAVLFKFNHSSPNCCLSSPYSSTGGCVCVTPDQKLLLANGGLL
jgi:hypothetical protein